ncbi:MAG TPA: energy transducer TonB [Gammaproteobacteria bacterium]|nr:energy transducer TonB [Gammaproteobacteria bacterium]
MLGLSLAIHLLGLVIWHSLQPQPTPLTLPVADLAVQLQYRQAKTALATSPPAMKAPGETVPRSVSTPTLIRTTAAVTNKPRKTLVKPEVIAKTRQTVSVKPVAPKPDSALQPATASSHAPAKKSASRISLSRVISRLQQDLKQYFYYPRLAQRRNIQGSVVLGFAISQQGKINHIRIIKSSGFAILDFAAEDALRQLNQLHWEQDYLQRNNQQIALPVIYQLTES